MVKTLARSIREYKKPALLTPLLVSVEVVLECIIPFIIADLVNDMQAGCDLSTIVNYGIELVIMANGDSFTGLRRGRRKYLRHGFYRLCEEPEKGHVLQNPGLLL